MKFWKKDTLMTSLLDKDFKPRDLIGKVILFAKQSSHATRSIIPRAHRWAFCTHVDYIKASFFQGLLQTFLLTIVCCHLLNLAAKFWGWVIVGNHCVFLATLLTTIALVHFESFEHIFGKRAMGRRLIKDKQSLTSQMCCLKDQNGRCLDLIN